MINQLDDKTRAALQDMAQTNLNQPIWPAPNTGTGSAGTGGTTGGLWPPAPYPTKHPAPCPACGHCPTCGRGSGWQPQPWPTYPQVWC